MGKDVRESKVFKSRQLYLLFHHIGIFVYICCGTEYIQSLKSEGLLLYYFITLSISLSLDLFSSACDNPGWIKAEPSNLEGLEYCNSCKLHRPIRATHCDICDRCVRRRDHHNRWTGVCVGRDNHLFFLCYVSVESISMCIIIYDIIQTVIKKHQKNFVVIIFGTFCLYNLYNMFYETLQSLRSMITNTTAIERNDRSTVEYLRYIPETDNPFDNGFIDNMKEFILMGPSKIEWDHPKIPEV